MYKYSTLLYKSGKEIIANEMKLLALVEYEG